MTIFVMKVSRHTLNRAPSSIDIVAIDTGIVIYSKIISYTRFARLIAATSIAITTPIDAIRLGIYIKVFGFTMPSISQLIGHIPNTAVWYSPNISCTDNEVISTSAIV